MQLNGKVQHLKLIQEHPLFLFFLKYTTQRSANECNRIKALDINRDNGKNLELL